MDSWQLIAIAGLHLIGFCLTFRTCIRVRKAIHTEFALVGYAHDPIAVFYLKFICGNLFKIFVAALFWQVTTLISLIVLHSIRKRERSLATVVRSK